MLTLEKSKELYDRACSSLAGGVSSEFRKFSQPFPLFYTRGEGAYIEDVDGNRYLDFMLGQGPLFLGHSPRRILEAVEKYSRAGQIFAGQHVYELELAEKLQSIIPCADLLRFSLSGSEAVHTALRVARAYTGRSQFLRFEGHYHGWFDNVARGITAPSMDALGSRELPNVIPWTEGLSESITEESVLLPWNDLGLLEKVLAVRYQDIAAIITEPVMCNNGCIPPEPGYLQGLRDLCDRYGIVLIFDEVITGFRIGLTGAQGYYDVTPDLAVFGKAMASGYPISMVAGKRPMMELLANGRVIHAGTMNSGHASVAAALATIETLEQDEIYANVFAAGQQLMTRLAGAAKQAGHSVLIQGLGPMFHLGFTRRTAVKEYRDMFDYDTETYAVFISRMQEKGIRLIGRGLWYLSAAHTQDDLDYCIDAAAAVFQEM